MKIALLNFPFDNNYGGNMQRYALMKVLQLMGHNVTHLFTCYSWNLRSRHPYLSFIKRILLRLCGRKLPLVPDYRKEYYEHKKNKKMAHFYKKYIKHTKPITPYDDLRKYDFFDAYIVGSDQVWRRSMSGWFPFHNMFFSFLTDKTNIKRIAYGVSFGNTDDEIPDDEKEKLGYLYSKFNAVSVREDSALTTLEKYGWTAPKAFHVLDPTMLLPREHYEFLIQQGKTKKSPGNLFCYVLDETEEVKEIIERISNAKHLIPFVSSIGPKADASVEQWLRSFLESEHIVTDSFHGFVFSIIFNKPVTLTYNHRRGNERFESLMRLLDYYPDVESPNWEKIKQRIDEEKSKSLMFLKEALQ